MEDILRGAMSTFGEDVGSPRFDDVIDGEVVKGAIDYVLLPLLILGVSGPIFVVMYIIMAYVEFRLPPNTQAGRGSDWGDGLVERVQARLLGRL